MCTETNTAVERLKSWRTCGRYDEASTWFSSMLHSPQHKTLDFIVWLEREERKMKGQRENKRADCSETKQGQSSSVTLVPGQAELCSTWELKHTHYSENTERKDWEGAVVGVIRSGSRVWSEEVGDREIIQRAIHNVRSAGLGRNLEPVQNAGAVVLNFSTLVCQKKNLLYDYQTYKNKDGDSLPLFYSWQWVWEHVEQSEFR